MNDLVSLTGANNYNTDVSSLWNRKVERNVNLVMNLGDWEFVDPLMGRGRVPLSSNVSIDALRESSTTKSPASVLQLSFNN